MEERKQTTLSPGDQGSEVVCTVDKNEVVMSNGVGWKVKVLEAEEEDPEEVNELLRSRIRQR